MRRQSHTQWKRERTKLVEFIIIPLDYLWPYRIVNVWTQSETHNIKGNRPFRKLYRNGLIKGFACASVCIFNGLQSHSKNRTKKKKITTSNVCITGLELIFLGFIFFLSSTSKVLLLCRFNSALIVFTRWTYARCSFGWVFCGLQNKQIKLSECDNIWREKNIVRKSNFITSIITTTKNPLNKRMIRLSC